MQTVSTSHAVWSTRQTLLLCRIANSRSSIAILYLARRLLATNQLCMISFPSSMGTVQTAMVIRKTAAGASRCEHPAMFTLYLVCSPKLGGALMKPSFACYTQCELAAASLLSPKSVYEFNQNTGKCYSVHFTPHMQGQFPVGSTRVVHFLV